MRTSRLAGVPLPRVALGTGTWPMNPTTTQAGVVELIHHLLNGSETPLFDTAPLYGHATSETWLGEVLPQYPRERYRVASKAGWELLPEGQVAHNLTRDGIRRSVEGSLKRLKVDYLDIVHLHDPDDLQREALDTAFPALYELRDQGVIRAIGSGMNQWQMLYEFAQHAEVDALLIAGRYTLLEQGAKPLVELCGQKGITLFAAGIYNSGVLATGSRNPLTYNYAPPPEAILARVRQLEEVCARHGVPLQRAAAQFPLRNPVIKTLVVGLNSVNEYHQTITALDTPIPAALWAELSSLGLIDDPAGS